MRPGPGWRRAAALSAGRAPIPPVAPTGIIDLMADQPLTSLSDVDTRLNAVRAARIAASNTADIVEFDRLDRELDRLLLVRHDMQRQEAA